MDTSGHGPAFSHPHNEAVSLPVHASEAASDPGTAVASWSHLDLRELDRAEGSSAVANPHDGTASGSHDAAGDVGRLLALAAKTAVPLLADGCEISLRGSSDEHVVAAAAWADPDWAEPSAGVRLRTEAVDSAYGAAHAKLIDAITDDMLVFDTDDAEHLRILRAFAPRSAVVAPIESDGVVIGRICWFQSRSGRCFSPDDLPAFRALAAGASLTLQAVLAGRAWQDALAARERADKRLRFVLDGARVGTWEWDIGRDAVSWSNALEEMHGFDPGTFGGTFGDWIGVVEPGDRDGLFSALRVALDGSDSFVCEYRQLRADGTTVWLEDRGRVVRDAGNMPVRVVGVCTDVTSRRASQMQEMMAGLAHAERMATVGQMTASILHEVGNPLAAIKTRIQSSLEIAQAGVRPSEWYTDVFRRVLTDVDRLANFLHSFRRLARHEVPARQPLMAARVLDDIASLMAPQLRRRGQRLLIDPGSSCPVFRADPSLIRHVLVNLVLNAADASPDDTEIRLISRAAGSYDSLVQFLVVDKGKGIPASDLDRVFDPFFTTRPGGTGLGLAICQRIVLGHHGRIQVQSTPGRGSTFTVTLPA